MGNIFQSAKFILELRSSASPNYEQDIGDKKPEFWIVIGQSDLNLASAWLIPGPSDIIIRGSDMSDSDYWTSSLILTRDPNISDPNIK